MPAHLELNLYARTFTFLHFQLSCAHFHMPAHNQIGAARKSDAAALLDISHACTFNSHAHTSTCLHMIRLALRGRVTLQHC